jgi:transcriptional regulator with XRE-family HTH domain
VTAISDASGARIAEFRRERGLTQRELADRAGATLWLIDQAESGRASPRPALDRLAAATGIAIEASAPLVDAPAARRFSTALPSLGRSGQALVLGSIVVLVTIRFFTEVVPVLPRALNFADIPIFLVLAVAALSMPGFRPGPAYLRVGPPALAFLVLAVVSAVVNANRVAPAPALVFVYGFLAPLAVYAAAYRIWPAGQARALSRLLVGLGLLQLVVVAVIGLPRFVSSGGNPDMISGTFGTNAYQLVFFLLLFAALVAGIFTLEPSRPIARFAPIVVPAVFMVVLLAQYRALLATSVIMLTFVGVLLGKRARGILAIALTMVAFALAFSYVASSFPNLKLERTASTLSESPWSYVAQRYEATTPMRDLYRDLPEAIAIGSGPGTFSSRAWQTFAKAGSESFSNVQGAYAQRLVGGVYSTDVSNEYVLPYAGTAEVVEGSRAVTSPHSSYLGLAAEVGLVGLALIVGVYALVLVRISRLSHVSIARAGGADSVPSLALATAVGFLTLVQMAFLENWLEVTRATFLVWIMLAVVGKELDARSGRER